MLYASLPAEIDGVSRTIHATDDGELIRAALRAQLDRGSASLARRSRRRADRTSRTTQAAPRWL